MLAKHFIRIMLVFAAIFVLLTSTVAAQVQAPAQPGHPADNPPDYPARNPAQKPASLPASQPAPVAAPGDLGAPGLHFRYVGKLGIDEAPYINYTDYINRPRGMYIDPSTQDLYITEEMGYRVLRYNSWGVNTLQIGEPGVNYRSDYTFDSPSDVALDANKNIWVADWARLAQYSPTGKYLQDLPAERPWETGSENGRFDQTYGIAFDTLGHMFVSDRNNHRVQVFTYDPNSSEPPQWFKNLGVTGEPGTGMDHFNNPGRIAVDVANTLYVNDIGNNRVQKCPYIPATQTWTCSTLKSGIEGRLEGITVDANFHVFFGTMDPGTTFRCTGNSCVQLTTDIWAYDYAVETSGKLLIANPWECIVDRTDADGQYQDTFLGTLHVCYKTDGSHYFQPRVSSDAQGNLLIVENAGHRILKTTRDGTPLWTFGKPGWDQWDDQHLTWPTRAVAGPDGRVYIADGQRVTILNSDGSYYSTFGDGWGTGDYNFKWASGVAFDPAGNLYVADGDNHRVMIYNSSLSYIGRIGNGTCEPSPAPADQRDFLCGPQDIVIDKSGSIYIADGWSNRVLKYNASRQLQMVLGEAYQWGGQDDLLHFASPEDLAVDAAGRIYVADNWNQRVLVYDAGGAYLSTISGGYGGLDHQMRSAASVDVDPFGRVYVSDMTNARIKLYEQGVPGWVQKNVDGFGDARNIWPNRMAVHNGLLYASALNDADGGKLWRSADGRTWSPVVEDGFANVANHLVQALGSFGGWLYVGTENYDTGGELWRCADCDGSDWEQVFNGSLFGAGYHVVQTVTEHGGALYATLDSGDGAIVARSGNGAPGSWAAVSDPGFGNVKNSNAWLVTEYGNQLYFVTAQWASVFEETSTGAEVWRCSACTGGDWEKVADAGFGSKMSLGSGIAVFKDQLYVGLSNWILGAQVWRCTVCDGTDWEKANTSGFGNEVQYSVKLFPFDGKLYAFANGFWGSAFTRGTQMFVSANGKDWTGTLFDGWGSGGASSVDPVAEFQGSLYAGVSHDSAGAEIWQMLPNSVFIPSVKR